MGDEGVFPLRSGIQSWIHKIFPVKTNWFTATKSFGQITISCPALPKFKLSMPYCAFRGDFICLPCPIHCTSSMASKKAIDWAIPIPHHQFVHFSKKTKAEDWWKSSLQAHNQRLNHSTHNLKVLRSCTVNLILLLPNLYFAQLEFVNLIIFF